MSRSVEKIIQLSQGVAYLTPFVNFLHANNGRIMQKKSPCLVSSYLKRNQSPTGLIIHGGGLSTTEKWKNLKCLQFRGLIGSGGGVNLEIKRAPLIIWISLPQCHPPNTALHHHHSPHHLRTKALQLRLPHRGLEDKTVGLFFASWRSL